jgi:hypothetical protein
MIRVLIWCGLAYIAYTLLKNYKLISKSKDPLVKEKDPYNKLNIEDADFEDINNEDQT